MALAHFCFEQSHESAKLGLRVHFVVICEVISIITTYKKMDVLVLWTDGTQNVVASTELIIGKRKRMTVGSKVKMYYEKKWYTGTILAVEAEDNSESESSDNSEDIPLSKLREKVGDKSHEKVIIDNTILLIYKSNRLYFSKPTDAVT